jgi:hypothetical protein
LSEDEIQFLGPADTPAFQPEDLEYWADHCLPGERVRWDYRLGRPVLCPEFVPDPDQPHRQVPERELARQPYLAQASAFPSPDPDPSGPSSAASPRPAFRPSPVPDSESRPSDSPLEPPVR